MQPTITVHVPERPSIEERAADPSTLDATLVLKLGYRGADFCGFAAQPGRRTVAGEVVRSLETLLRREVDLTCAGRTDAGVHAIAQRKRHRIIGRRCRAAGAAAGRIADPGYGSY